MSFIEPSFASAEGRKNGEPDEVEEPEVDSLPHRIPGKHQASGPDTDGDSDSVGQDEEKSEIQEEPLPYELESAVFTECVDGACSTSLRPVLSNRTREQVREIASNFRNTRDVAFARAQLADLPLLRRETERAVEIARKKITENPDEMIEVVLHLPEKGFDFSRVRTAKHQKDSKKIALLREERTAQLLPSQTRVENLVTKLGG